MLHHKNNPAGAVAALAGSEIPKRARQHHFNAEDSNETGFKQGPATAASWRHPMPKAAINSLNWRCSTLALASPFIRFAPALSGH